MTEIDLAGCRILKGYLDRAAQETLRDDIRSVVAAAPFFSPTTAWGKPMSVGMTSAGKYGWFSDRSGYRYVDRHPSGAPWPEIPKSVLRVWATLGPADRQPDCCLINYYKDTAKMGLHQDKDEASFDWPVISISLGDTGSFRVGGQSRKDPTQKVDLESGDIAILDGPSRLAYHGIDRIKFGSSSLLKNGGRLNLTLRVVD